MNASPTVRAFARTGHLAVGALLVLAYVTGGGSYDRGPGDIATQLLALPLIAWSALVLAQTPGSALRRAAVGVAGLVALVLALQQVSLPPGLWQSIDARGPLAADLQAAGVDSLRATWSLSPLASEAGAWSILPALAVFLGTLALPPARHRALLLTVVILAAASLVLGYLQLGAPQDSLLNPFPEWAPALNGIFASQNHQATSLAVALAAILAMLLYDRNRVDDAGLPRWKRVALGITGVLMLASLPLTNSRAALLIAVLVLVGVALALRHGARSQARSTGRQRIGQAALALLAVGAIASAFAWLQVDIAEEVRWDAATATAAMAGGHAPTGAGVGSFIPWFDQAAPEALIGGSYFNHAHNEYAQWWFESGVGGLLAVLATLLLLAWVVPRRARGTPGTGIDRGAAVAAWAGCLVLMLHSIVDYPLRTPALMTVGALLLAMAVPQGTGAASRRPRPAKAPPADAAPQHA